MRSNGFGCRVEGCEAIPRLQLGDCFGAKVVPRKDKAGRTIDSHAYSCYNESTKRSVDCADRPFSVEREEAECRRVSRRRKQAKMK